jgi:hypothetical protein
MSFIPSAEPFRTRTREGDPVIATVGVSGLRAGLQQEAEESVIASTKALQCTRTLLAMRQKSPATMQPGGVYGGCVEQDEMMRSAAELPD